VNGIADILGGVYICGQNFGIPLSIFLKPFIHRDVFWLVL
jgi:hypothetical protein